jgi:WD40 repeat protein/serine/threonine protein kinase
MTSRPSSRGASLPLDAQERVDEVCSRFEQAWKDGRRPRIEDHLGEISDEFRPALLRELLAIEAAYRLDLGELPTADDYRLRFPNCTDLLAELMRPRPPPSPTVSTAPATRDGAAPGGAAAPAAEAPGVPGYRIDRLLGKGGMSAVWLGHDRRLNRAVAVKVMHDQLCGHSHLARRFIEEAQVASQLQHPAIPPVHELGELPDGRPYFAMKVVKGRTLAELLQQRPGPAEDRPRFLTIFEQVCQAVAYAHSKGVIHRDLKPHNVMVGAFGEVQVMDWGLAKVLAAEPPASAADPPESVVETARKSDAGHATQAGSVLGTYAYMPPEQARGEVALLDRRCDVFGLGAILCEILTGQPPYAGSPEERKVRAQLGHVAPALERLGTCGADGELVDLARRCLGARPEERPDDAAAVAGAVARYQAGVQQRLRQAELEGATAAAKAREEEARATAAAERRSRRLALGLAAALVVGLAATAYALVVAHQERQKAEGLAGTEAAAHGAAEQERRKAEEERRNAEGLAAKEASARKAAEEQKQQAEEERRRADAARNVAEDYRRRAEWLSYVAQIAHAQRAWQDGDMVQAQDLLGGCQKQLRGWEHRYVSTLVNRRTRALLGHSGGVNVVCFNADGKRLATGGADGTVRVWDVATGREALVLVRARPALGASAWGLLGSPHGQGPLLAASALVPERPHASPVYGVCFSPDGRRLASASWDGAVKVWDAQTGQEALALRGQTDGVWDLCFSPDGKRLASAGADGTVMVWDAATGREALLTFKGHTKDVRGVCFSPDGTRLVSASRDGTVKAWDAATGQGLFILQRHTEGVQGVCYSPDGGRLASAAADGTVQVWDARPRQEARTLKGHTGGVQAVSFSPDSGRLASAAADGTVKVWDVATGRAERTLTGHTGEVWGVCFSPDGRRLATASRDRTVRVWEAQTGRKVLALSGHTDEVSDVCFSPDGKWLATASADGTVKVSHADGWQAERTFKGHIDKVWGVCFSPDGRHLASASRDQTVRVWEAATGREVLTLTGHTSEVRGVCFSPDGKQLATASADETVRVWDAQTGQESLTLRGHTGEVWGVCFSPDGERLASASRDGTVRLWDTATGQETLVLKGHTGWVLGVRFSPDGQRLASASDDQTVKVWDAAEVGGPEHQ